METIGFMVEDREHLRRLLAERTEAHYVYLLYWPDWTPFYVGIGQGMRLFAHVDEAQDQSVYNDKVAVIRRIQRDGGAVLHAIEGWYEVEPWAREAELIRCIGQGKYGAGPLTNAQRYAPSHEVGGVVTRKYRERQGDDVAQVPDSFRLADRRLMAGPRPPRSRHSVHGKIYTMLEGHPGVTGRELVGLMQDVDFSGNKSAYTQGGTVCAAWLCGYIDSAYFRRDRGHVSDWDNGMS